MRIGRSCARAGEGRSTNVDLELAAFHQATAFTCGPAVVRTLLRFLGLTTPCEADHARGAHEERIREAVVRSYELRAQVRSPVHHRAPCFCPRPELRVKRTPR